MTAVDGAVSITQETVDIIGQDGSKASEGASHKTNVHFKQTTQMGINDGNISDTTQSNEARGINPGEAWIFKFNTINCGLNTTVSGELLSLASSS